MKKHMHLVTAVPTGKTLRNTSASTEELWLWYRPAFKTLKKSLLRCLCLIFSYFSVFVFAH